RSSHAWSSPNEPVGPGGGPCCGPGFGACCGAAAKGRTTKRARPSRASRAQCMDGSCARATLRCRAAGSKGRRGGGERDVGRNRAKVWRDRAEARLVRGFEWLARRLPVERSVRFGERLGELLAVVDRRRRRVGLANLALAYGDALDEAARAKLIAGVY